MFSYRHAFHAGNHADVLKHTVLIQLLRHLAAKDSPFWVIDTHAGAGVYALDGEWATTRSEFADGIGRLWTRDDAPEPVADYLELVRGMNPDGALRVYPGSPFIALKHLRPRDRLRLFEAHVNEIKTLQHNLRQAPRDAQRLVLAAGTDGFANLKSLLPPPPRRALVLIDPSYEDKRDYVRVVDALRDGLKRFATGCFAIWYPEVQRPEPHEMLRALTRIPNLNWLLATLDVRGPSRDGLGLHGSGMFIVNPPWTLADSMAGYLPWLTDVLGLDRDARWSLETSGD